MTHKPQAKGQPVDLDSGDNLICQMMAAEGFSNACISREKGFSTGQITYRTRTKRKMLGREPITRSDYRNGYSPLARWRLRQMANMSPEERKHIDKQLGIG